MEIVLMLAIAIINAGIIGIVYKFAKSKIEKAVRDSDNKIDDLLLDTLGGQADKLKDEGVEKLKELLERKLEERRGGGEGEENKDA